MTSFGEAIGLTPLQLTSLISTIANGGTMYWLQYPKSQEEVLSFVPKVKRELDIQAAVPEMKPGMMGAVDFGTARRAGYSSDEPIMGKTGTCTDARTHLGWFGSFNEVNGTKLAVTVLLTGGSAVNGPVASGIAGLVYKHLSEQNWFAKSRELTPSAEVLTGTSGYVR
jgi:cell division protein FtsI/penicillin-binding protein 2